MNMTWHDAPGIDCQPFILLAINPAADEFVFIFGTYKQVYPSHNGKTDKIHAFRITEFVFTAHGKKIIAILNLKKAIVLWIRTREST